MRLHIRPLLAAALCAVALQAQAVYTVNIVETGGDVVVTGSGSLNTTGLTLGTSATGCSVFGYVTASLLCIGASPGGNVILAGGALTPALSGLTGGTASFAASGTGDEVTLSGSSLFLPLGYVSGAPLSQSSTYPGQTFATMGLIRGTRTLSLPNDTIVINVGPVASTPVPTLGAYGLMGLSSLLALAGWWGTRRRRA